MKGGKNMGDHVIELNELTKCYGKNTVVDKFSLSVEKGHICGLIGPNGAGKTTFMRMIAGLTAPTSGEMRFFGKGDDLDRSRRRMSFMLEAPIIDPNLTAWQNMQYVRFVKGIANEKKITENLEFVKLGDTGKKPAGKFSLGMKQRLGIAMALMNDPEIMVLDEPVNGLDPEGIVEVRHMLKKLSDERGVTIIISSHILPELAELCSDFTIINHGKLIESFSSDELLSKCRSRISIRTDNINETAAVLEKKLGIREYKAVHGEEIHLFERLDDIKTVSKTITDSGFVITKFVEEGESLEEYYLSKVGVSNE